MKPKQKYHDVKFFLIAIAFISAFNYYLTWSNIRFNWFLIATYTIDTVQGWLAWWAMRTIIIWLDKKMPYGHNPLKRIGVQLVITTVAGLLTIIILTELVSWLVRGKPALLNFYLFDIFIFTIWFLVINGIYIGMHYYSEWKNSEDQRRKEREIRSTGYTVKQGKQNVLIAFDEILSFYADEGYTVLLTRQNKKYLQDRSLDKIEDSLPEESFFRLNRQYIIHRSAVKGFKRTGDGKIDVLLAQFDHLPEAIQVSRTKAVSFKIWFQPEDS